MPLKLTLRTDQGEATPVWYVTGTHLGRRIRRSTGETDYAKAKKIFEKALPGLLKTISDGHYASDSFGKLCDDYEKANHDARFLPPLKAALGRRPTNEITDQDIRDLADALGTASKKGSWSPATKNRQCVDVFVAVCNWGARQKPPRCAPRLIETFEEDHVPVTAAPEEWILRVLDGLEVEHRGWAHQAATYVAAGAQPYPDTSLHLSALILVLTTTAARISEGLRLTWDDVKLFEGFAILRKTKSGNARRIELAPVVVDALKRIGPPMIGQRLFPWSTRKGVEKKLRLVCKRLGVPYYSSHEWGRHAFAERMLRKGYSLKHVKDAGGWASLSVLEKNYGHLEAQAAQAAVVQVAQASLERAPKPLIELQGPTKTGTDTP
jgi:hypothetical protein